MEIGTKIKNLRLQNGLTQEELGNRCELSKGFISLLESDKTSPSMATLDLMNEICWLIPNAQKNKMEPILITLQPGGSTYPDNPHEGEEVGYVLEGTITIVIDKERYQAKKGESFYIACDKPHYLENKTSHQAKAIWISSPPMF